MHPINCAICEECIGFAKEETTYATCATCTRIVNHLLYLLEIDGQGLRYYPGICYASKFARAAAISSLGELANELGKAWTNVGLPEEQNANHEEISLDNS